MFDREGIRYCVLHGYETLPEEAISDVDLALDPRQRGLIDAVLLKVASDTGFLITQKLYYDVPYCHYYVLAHTSAAGS